MLKDIFYQLSGSYSQDQSSIARLWDEIETAYSESRRHYHTLEHLRNMFDELYPCRSEIANWEPVLFALFYHDIVYDVLKTDNEHKSAEVAQERLSVLTVSSASTSKCKEHILATKHHQRSADPDANYLLDADLSILGSEWPAYERYVKQVRKEYSIFPDIIFRPGRRKVLRHFLDMEMIFKTSLFQQKYERRARENLQRELNQT